MNLVVNGKQIQLQEPVSLAQFLADKGFDHLSVVVEHNYEIIPRQNFKEITLKEGDHLEIVKFIGGG